MCPDRDRDPDADLDTCWHVRAALDRDPFTQNYQVMRPNAALQSMVRVSFGPVQGQRS